MQLNRSQKAPAYLALSFAICAICALCLAVRAQEPLSSLWRDASIHRVPLTDYGVHEGVRYLVSNDHRYLHVRLVYTEETDQQKLLLFGNTLRLGDPGATRIPAEIRFPYREGPGRVRDTSPPVQGELRELRREAIFNFVSVRQELVDRSRRIGLFHMTDTADFVAIPSGNPLLVHGWMAVDSSGFLLWEVVVPLDELPGRDPADDPVLVLEAETGYLDRSRRRNPDQAGSPGRFRSLSEEERAEMFRRMQALREPTRIRIGRVRLATR